MEGSQPPPSQQSSQQPVVVGNPPAVVTVAAAPPPLQQYPAFFQVPQQQPTPGVQFVPAPTAMIQQPMQPAGGQTVMSSAVEFSQPSHHLVLTVVVTAICAIINLTSLMIGVPALICGLIAYNALSKQSYSVTKRLGYTAVLLSLFNIIYTGIATIVVVGVAIGCTEQKRTYYSSYSNGPRTYYYNYCEN